GDDVGRDAAVGRGEPRASGGIGGGGGGGAEPSSGPGHPLPGGGRAVAAPSREDQRGGAAPRRPGGTARAPQSGDERTPSELRPRSVARQQRPHVARHTGDAEQPGF